MNKLKKDTVLKDFWRDNNRFASLFNGFLFGGRNIIKPEKLEEKDTDVSGVVWKKEYAESVSRFRDVVKKMAYGIEFVILGIESQDKVHYAMPLRVMIYDALEYLKEYQELTRFYKNHPEVLETPEEFLSKMRKGDRLHPIITIVIYYGEEEWDGPLSLADMTEDVSKEIQEVFSNYQINLLQIRDTGKYQFADKDVQIVFDIIREIQLGEFQKIKERYNDTDIRAELLRVIGTIVKSEGIVEQANQGKEAKSMYKSLELLLEENRQIGISQGISQGITQGLMTGLLNSIELLLSTGQEIGTAISNCAIKFEMSENEVWDVWNSR